MTRMAVGLILTGLDVLIVFLVSATLNYLVGKGFAVATADLYQSLIIYALYQINVNVIAGTWK